LHRADVSAAADPEAAAVEWMQADMRRPVDLRGGPLFTGALFRVAPRRFLWYQRAHHIAVDGYGGWVIAGRVAEIYTALAAGAPPAAGALEPFGALIEADARYRASADFGADREFWAGALAGFAGAASLSGRPAAQAVGAPLRAGQELSADELAGLRAAAQRLGTGLSALLGGGAPAADPGDDGQRGPGPAAGGRADDGPGAGRAGAGGGADGAAAPAVPGRGHRPGDAADRGPGAVWPDGER
jgi:nonribosomal peptide synthetase DhbF